MAEGKELEIKKQESMTPGFGVAGQVMCPLSFMAPKICNKQGCEWWVELTYGETKVARCSMAWMAVLSTEIRMAIDKLKGAENATTKKSDTNSK